MALALYIHWPFCQSKCPYCDFNSHVAAEIEHEAWRKAYVRELQHTAKRLPGQTITSIFFGGGTPSLMEPQTIEVILDTIAGLWPMDKNTEITLEANPGSSEAGKFEAFRQAGVNRLSLGVQSLRDEALTFLGRRHNASEARAAIELAARIFPRSSFDLIYARQGQTLASWEAELQEALALAGDHLSLYQLTIEPHTLFHTRAGRGEELTTTDDTAATMYEVTQDILSAAGLPAYEISNHAAPGEESRHNLTYWNYQDYAGIGPGAHGRLSVSGVRLATDNHRAPEVWMTQVMTEGHGLRQSESLDQNQSKREALMMGLRLTRGLSHNAWQQKFGSSLKDDLPHLRLERLIQEGYLTDTPEALRATAGGLQRLNAVLGYLVD